MVAERCVSASVLFRGPACAFADFDGDQIADFAYATKEIGLDHHVASITVHLTSSANDQTLDLSIWPAATGLTSRDVDGDLDNDLVVTTGLVRRRVAVFLNDGTGIFVLDAEERFLADPEDDHDLVAQTNEPATMSIEDGGCSPHLGLEDVVCNQLPPVRDRFAFQPHAFARDPAVFHPSLIRAP